MNTATYSLFLADDPRRTPEAIARRREQRVVERDEQGRLLPGSCLTGAGRPAGVGPSVTSLARSHTERAITLLGQVMDDAAAPISARVQAAQILLDRAWGKCPISIDLSARTNFCDFLKSVGVAANYERHHAESAYTEE